MAKSAAEIIKSNRSPNFWTAEWYFNEYGERREKRVLVVHKTEGAFESDLSWLCNPDSQVSSHYLINRNGDIYELVDPADIAWHCGESSRLRKKDGPFRAVIGWGNENVHTVGVELVGRPTEFFTEEQYRSLAIVQQLNGIPLDSAHTIGHLQITTRKSDPQLFNWDHYRDVYRDLDTPAAEVSYFAFETGYEVAPPFRGLWDKYGLAVIGYPLGDPYTEDVPGLGKVTFQDFENVVLWVDTEGTARFSAGIRKYKYGK